MEFFLSDEQGPLGDVTRRCIYCGRDKPAVEFTDEHIWPDALGGDCLPSQWRTDDVCGKCNNLAGLFVDGVFIKSFFGSAERWHGAHDYLTLSDVDRAVLPLAYLSRLRDVPLADNEVAEFWSGPCGAHIIHIRPAIDEATWSSYAGGDPRARKLAAGRAYMSFTSTNPFWITVAVNSFKAHFRRAKRYLVNSNVPPQWAADFSTPDPTDETTARDLVVVKHVADASRRKQSVRSTIEMRVDQDSRLLAKIALGVGHNLLGKAFDDSPYAALLRQALWEKDFQKRQSIPVRGSGYLNGGSALAAIVPVLHWPGAWVLMLNVVKGSLCLTVVSPGKMSMGIVVTDDGQLVSQLGPDVHDGIVWLTVPSIQDCVGPLPQPAYIAHQIGASTNEKLQALAAKRNRDVLPPC